MVSSLNSGVIDKNSSVTDYTGHSACTMFVKLNKLLRLCWLHQFGDHLLFDSKDDSLVSFNSNGCRSMVDSFEGILNLIDSSFWRESVDTTIVVLLTKADI